LSGWENFTWLRGCGCYSYVIVVNWSMGCRYSGGLGSAECNGE